MKKQLISSVILCTLTMPLCGIATEADSGSSLGFQIAPPVTTSPFNPLSGVLLQVINSGKEQAIYTSAGSDSLEPGKGGYASDTALPLENGYQYINLNNQMIFTPKILVMPAGQSGTLRVMIKRPPNLPDGTYFLSLKLAPKSAPVQLNSQEQPKGASQAAASIVVGLNYNIYLNNGTGNADKAEVSCKIGADGKLNMLVKNNTSYLFRPDVTLVQNDQTVATLTPQPLLPYSMGTRLLLAAEGKTGTYSLNWTLPGLSKHTVACQ